MSEVYTDQRYHEYQGPSRTVRHPRACSVGGGAFATSEDGSRCVVAGKDVLRILRITEPVRSRKLLSHSHGHISSNSSADLSPRVCTGPGGASIEIGPNMWTASGLKIDSAPTDVVWARGTFDNKIVTSARNGEIIYWDINKSGSKYETRIKEHKRAVNKLAISPFLPYLFASGSQDGHLRVWDLRTPPSSSMKVYHPTGIRALALSPVPSNPMTVCTGLESGNIQRWDLRNKALPLERITLAHSSSILSMDWQLPSMKETGLGWLVTSGMDRRVKVWNLCLPPGTPMPANMSDRDAMLLNKKMGPRAFRTLHTPFPVRNVCWRPGYDCEVAIISNNEFESETVEIWDIRRGWIGKWGLDDAEGGITDISFSGSHKLWAQYVNGTFVQHDLRESFRPLDSIPRVAMSWAAYGNLAFVANNQPMVEVPFDDINPFRAFPEKHLRHKATSDPVYVPVQQALGVDHVPVFDHAAFVCLAKSYVFNGERIRICEINAERAKEVGHLHAMQTWLLLSSQLGETSPSSVCSIAPPSYNEPQGHLSSTSVSATSQSGLDSLNHTPALHLGAPLNAPIDTRPTESSPLSYGKRRDQLTHSHGPPLFPSPRLKDIPLASHISQPNLSSTILPYDASVSPNQSNTASRRASTVLPLPLRSHRPVLRRASISAPGIAGVASPKHNVGEGALDDSDSDSSSGPEALLSEAIIPHRDTRRTLSTSVAPAAGPTRNTTLARNTTLTRNTTHASPLSRLVSRKDSPDDHDSPDGHLAGDECSVDEYDTDMSDASHSPPSTSSSSSFSAKGNSSRNILQTLKQNEGEERSQMPSTRRSHRHRRINLALSYRSLTKQESQNSMRTVTAPPSDAASTHTPSLDRRPLDTPDPSQDSLKITVLKSEGLSTRRPSPQHHRVVPAPIPVLGLSNMDATMNVKTNSHQPILNGRLSEGQRSEIEEDEAHLREIGWKALRETLDLFAEKGDVQMCALLAIVAPIELRVSPVRAARFFEAYIDLLSRLQLHTLAAHLRKYVPYDVIRDTTQVQTTVYSSCGRCGTAAKMAPTGGSASCAKCNSLPILCAVCHLPVRKLLVYCTGCGHGGHQTCYRGFYLARPLTELPTHTPGTFPYGPTDSYSSTDASSTTYYSLSDGSERGTRGDDGVDDDDDSEQDGGSGGRGSDKERGKEELHEYEMTTVSISERRPRMRVLGHACAAGCGHWCWAANERLVT